MKIISHYSKGLKILLTLVLSNFCLWIYAQESDTVQTFTLRQKGNVSTQFYFAIGGVNETANRHNNYQSSTFIFLNFEHQAGYFFYDQWELGVFGSYYLGRGDSSIQAEVDYFHVGAYARFYPFKKNIHFSLGYGLINAYVPKSRERIILTDGFETHNLTLGAGFNIQLLKKHTNRLFFTMDMRTILCFRKDGCTHIPRSFRTGLRFLLINTSQ